MSLDKHNPGSKEAQALGCVCPVEDNNSGLWSPFGKRDAWVLSALCEYHHTRSEETEVERKIAHIESIMNKDFVGYIECDHGWDELIIKCHEELIALDPNYVPVQIKQKFGGLRYYFDTQVDERTRLKMYETTGRYETLSLKTCELTGGPGVLMKEGGTYFTVNPEYAPDGAVEVNPNE
jgi:hypothetical protein